MKISNIQRVVAILALFVISISSCEIEDFDFDKMAGPVNWKPELFAPIANGNYILDDFLNLGGVGDSTINTDEEGLIHIIYLQDSLFNYDASELVDFPDQMEIDNQDFLFRDIDLGAIELNASMTLEDLTNSIGTLSGLALLNGSAATFPAVPDEYVGDVNITNIDEYEYVDVDSANLTFTITNNLPVEIDIEIDLYDVDNSTIISSFILGSIAPGNSVSDMSIVKDISLSNNLQVSFKKLSIEASAGPEMVDLTDEILLQFSLSNIFFSEGSVKLPELGFEEISDEHYFGIAGLEGEDVKIFQTTIKEGFIDIEASSDIDVEGIMEIELMSATKSDGTAAIFQIDLNQLAATHQIDISGLNIDLTAGATMSHSTLPYRISMNMDSTSTFVQIYSSDKISIDISLNNITPSYIEGDFGSQIVSIDPGEMTMEVDMLGLFDGGFALTDPRLSLLIKNSIGMPSLVNAQFTATNSDNISVDLDPEDIEIPYPEDNSEGTITSTITYDKDNSNIINFIALPPSDNIEYNGTVEFNPDGAVDPATPNFITDESFITIGIEVDLPIELKTDMLGIKDTMAIDSMEIEGVDRIALMMTITNGIPLDISLGFTFVDTITGIAIGDQLDIVKILAAQTNSEGDVEASTVSTTEIAIEADDFDNLKNASGLAIDITLNSPSQGTIPAKILAQSEFGIAVGIRAIISPSDLIDSNSEDDDNNYYEDGNN